MLSFGLQCMHFPHIGYDTCLILHPLLINHVSSICFSTYTPLGIVWPACDGSHIRSSIVMAIIEISISATLIQRLDLYPLDKSPNRRSMDVGFWQSYIRDMRVLRLKLPNRRNAIDHRPGRVSETRTSRSNIHIHRKLGRYC